AIRATPESFLKGGREATRDEEYKHRVKQLVERALDADRVDDRDTVRRRLLEVLFPRLKGIFGNTTYGSDWDNRWEREQRVCAEGYFHRYFRYGIPPGDIPDLEVNALLEVARQGDEAELDRRLRKMAEVGG